MNRAVVYYCYFSHFNLADAYVFLHYLQGEANMTFSQCSRFAVNWTALLQMNELTEISPNKSWPVEPCLEGWEYDTMQVTSSIVSDVSTQECGTVTKY